jgi:nucleotide-binding universal stress UspA family protein
MARSIVVGTDGSDLADKAIREAAEIAARDGARLHIVTAYPDPAFFREQITSGATRVDVNLREVADAVLARAEREAAALGAEVVTHASEEGPAEAILDVAKEEDADLIVVGQRGLSGLQRFLLGSVSSKVAQHASCSVLIVRPDSS